MQAADCKCKKQMKGKAMRQLFYFVLFLSLAFGPRSCFGFWPGKKHFVRIKNELSTQQLNYHCESDMDDLGDRILAPHQEWEFKFRASFDTYFQCSMWYANFIVTFDVFYPSDAFMDRCGGVHCIWRTQESGIYLFHINTGEWEKMYDWGTRT